MNKFITKDDIDHIGILRQEIIHLMKVSGRIAKGKSILHGDALKLIETANKSRLAKDLIKAYQLVLDLSYSPEQRKLDDIQVFLDAMSWYTLRFISDEYVYPQERTVARLVPVEIESGFMQHYINHWKLHGCYKLTPDNDVFWRAWHYVYQLTVKYQARMPELYIKRLFIAFDRENDLQHEITKAS